MATQNPSIPGSMDNTEISTLEQIQRISITLDIQTGKIQLTIPGALKNHRDKLGIAGAIVQRIVFEHGSGKSLAQIRDMIPENIKQDLKDMGIVSIESTITSFMAATTVSASNRQ